jgi:hypothetical protein
MLAQAWVAPAGRIVPHNTIVAQSAGIAIGGNDCGSTDYLTAVGHRTLTLSEWQGTGVGEN